jgi:hypothetical protein
MIEAEMGKQGIEAPQRILGKAIVKKERVCVE